MDLIVNDGQIMSPMPANGYTVLCIPPYKLAMTFLSSNLASFGRSIVKDGTTPQKAHYLNRLLSRQANQNQSAFSLFSTWVFHGEHRGNGYVYIRRADPTSAKVVGLYNLLTEDVIPFRLIPEDGSLWDVEYWYWHIPSKAALPSADVLHYKGLSNDGWLGYDNTQLSANTLSRAIALEQYAKKYIEKGTLIKGVIETPVGTSSEQCDEIIATLAKFKANSQLGRDVMLLKNGATLKNITLNAEQSQLIEQDQELTKKIAQATGVDPVFLFERSESQYVNNAGQAGENVVKFTFRTRIEAIEDELTLKLVTSAEIDAGLAIKLNADALLRGDPVQQAEVATTLAGGPVKTPNEARADLALPAETDPAADKLRAPTKGTAETAPQSDDTAADDSGAKGDAYAALQPILQAAAARVDGKAAKAVETLVKLPDLAERYRRGNVLADQQSGYATEALRPLADALVALGAKPMDVAAIANRHAAEVRRQVGGEKGLTIMQLIEGGTNGK